MIRHVAERLDDGDLVGGYGGPATPPQESAEDQRHREQPVAQAPETHWLARGRTVPLCRGRGGSERFHGVASSALAAATRSRWTPSCSASQLAYSCFPCWEKCTSRFGWK